MYPMMRFTLLCYFLILGVVKGEARMLPARDQEIINELKTLGDNLLNETLNSELNSRITVAQLIIDSNVAQPSVIEGMQAFITQWRPLLSRVSVEDYGRFSVEFPVALELEVMAKYKDEDGGLNYYTRGAFSAIKVKAATEDRQRLTAYKDTAVLKMAEVSQDTKQANYSLMNAFDDFVNQTNLSVRNFFTFLRALREY
ncbi:uncharacterized protein LOC117781356 [Drosophila innubila]|uniref:uncharacterized protein LOC117781356 n=1 Tax=Drosophila innubila TaxID=198719 RepID=UPI00148D860B|nr:uncharacterized protein LOC117781356 [Drosophila innubila]